MDYFNAAFGNFAPNVDQYAAIKFILNVILMDERLPELAELIVDGSQMGGMEGEPGWILERRDVADENNAKAYLGWPAGARFKAHVDENAFQLGYPELYLNRRTFLQFVMSALNAYVAAEPARDQILSVIALRNAGLIPQRNEKFGRTPGFDNSPATRTCIAKCGFDMTNQYIKPTTDTFRLQQLNSGAAMKARLIKALQRMASAEYQEEFMVAGNTSSRRILSRTLQVFAVWPGGPTSSRHLTGCSWRQYREPSILSKPAVLICLSTLPPRPLSIRFEKARIGRPCTVQPPRLC